MNDTSIYRKSCGSCRFNLNGRCFQSESKSYYKDIDNNLLCNSWVGGLSIQILTQLSIQQIVEYLRANGYIVTITPEYKGERE
jgi:hypothetical protein